MGSARFYAEEAPVRQVKVDPFLMDETPVTNAEFAAFVAATGHVTLAEIAPSPDDYPGLLPEAAIAGSAVFDRVEQGTGYGALAAGWSFRPGADWRRPLGHDSSIDGIEDHPVVHIAYQDAQAYADWTQKSLPTEAEWEFAARGGLEGADYAWGDELAPGGAMLANYWQGRFPHVNELLDGWERTSPVRSFAANGHGLFDLIGNVWEWTADWWSLHEASDGQKASCCVPSQTRTNPRGGTERDSHGSGHDAGSPRKVLKGGSYLCAANYCQRYRPAARHAQAIDTSTSHIGFRCVVRLGAAG
ncbi:formylglycine-generating enzyme family protein [soil metagenome]